MAKIISSLYIDMYRNIHNNLNNNEPKTKIILVRLRKVLRNLDYEKWQEYEEFFYTFSYLTELNETYMIILFILIDAMGEEFFDKDKDCVAVLIESFWESNLNPYNYDDYLRMFLNDEIFVYLKYGLDTYSLDKTRFIITKIIESFEYKYLKGNNSKKLIGILAKIFNRKKTFNYNDFLYLLVDKLSQKMIEANREKVIFTLQDFQITQKFLCNLVDLSETEIKAITLRLQEIDKISSVEDIKNLLNFIQSNMIKSKMRKRTKKNKRN